MTVNDKNIERYIELFLMGETSNEEEALLYNYFRTADVPPHLKQYKQMFDWYADGMPASPEEYLKPRKNSSIKEIWAFCSGIAAIAIMVAGIAIHIANSSSLINAEQYTAYEGSYIEHNGRRIYDLNIIMPRLQQIILSSSTPFAVL